MLTPVLFLSSHIIASHPLIQQYNEQNFRRRKDVNKEVSLIESSIKDEIHSNEKLLLTLRHLEEKIRETGKGIDQLLEDEPGVLRESQDSNSKTILHDIHLVS